jgi:hypothetical protein
MSDDTDLQSSTRRDRRWLRQIAPGAVALAAILLAVWEGFENRRHNRLSVVPNVDASRNFDMRGQKFDMGLLSSGLGPAVVQDLRIFVDGRMVYDKHSEHDFAWTEIFPLYRGKNMDIWDDYHVEGEFLIPGQRYDLFRVEPRGPDVAHIENFRELADRISVVLCYCSIYGDQCATETVGVHDVDEGACP